VAETPELRTADADRDRAVQRLHLAATEGRLDAFAFAVFLIRHVLRVEE
jgi:hypothetical protein